MAYQVDGWTALADPTRRRIFERIGERPRAVGELAHDLPVSRPAVSQHLKVLKEARLVVDRPAGNRRIYELNPDGLHPLRAQLERFWDQALAAYKRRLEESPEEEKMSTRTTDTSVRKEIVVDAPIERAFRVFTEEFDKIKPHEHNLLAEPIAETVFEPRVGGHIYDRGVDGSECRWARVLAYEPPNRVVFTWEISPQWQLEADSTRASEVEVRFVSEGSTRTRVVLEHRKLDNHLEGWEGLRDGIAGAQGWPLYLERYSELLR